MTAGWDTTWLCKGCGSALALSYRNPETGRVEQIIEADKNARGDFFRCIRCGGKHYYSPDKGGAPVFRGFEAGPPFYRSKRKLGLAK